MKIPDLLEHKARLNARLEELDLEKVAIARQIKAVDVLLESARPSPSGENKLKKKTPSQEKKAQPALLPGLPSHTVRSSPRNTLIGAVKELAAKQRDRFDSLAIIDAIKKEYPEFGVADTKHISSQLNDLVKRGVLEVVEKRCGAKPNLYRYLGE